MHLGIDWGTSYTKLGYWDNGRLINLAGEGESIPTVVTFLPSTGRLYFGNPALRLNEPDACSAQFFKLELKRNPGYRLGPFDLPGILQEFFTFLEKEYVAPLKEPVDSITIGIPNYFGLKARNILLKTIKNCFGAEQVNMLLEPAAAATGYNLTHPDKPLTGDILSIDIGGGTCDFSFLTLEHYNNRLILESQLQIGHDVFSGSEIDRTMVRKIFFPAFKMQTGKDVADNLINEKSLTSHQNFRLNKMLKWAENLKKALTVNPDNYINIPDFYDHHSLILKVDRDMFYSQTRSIFNRLEEYIYQSLRSQAGRLGIYQAEKWHLDYILLVGGGSLTLGVKELLASIFDDIPIVLPDYQEFDVLTGLCAWEMQNESSFPTMIKTIYPFHFFIERFSADQQTTVLDKLPFDTSNLALDIKGFYKILTLAPDSAYNLSSDPNRIKFRIYEASEEEDNISVQQFSGRDMILEIDALKAEVPAFIDVYLDLQNAQLHTSLSSPLSPNDGTNSPQIFPGLLKKQLDSLHNYQMLNFANPDLLEDYEKYLNLKDSNSGKPYQDHIQATLFKLYALIDLLKP